MNDRNATQLLLAALLALALLPIGALPPALSLSSAYATSGADFLPGAFPADNDSTSAVVLGDVDGDGDLDIVTGNYHATNKLYLNNGTASPFAGVTGANISDDANFTTSLALGDVDGDGDLDLVAGNNGQASKLYLNNGTSVPFANVTGAPISNNDTDTLAVALGDVDSDRDLDLITGSGGDQAGIKLYLNDGDLNDGDDLFDAGTSIGSADITGAVALGDMNGDGYLDLVAGSGYSTNKLYLHNTTANPFAGVEGKPIGSSGDEDYTVSIVLGDVNGDSHLDLIIGRESIFSMETILFLNNGSRENPFFGVTGSTIITNNCSDVPDLCLSSAVLALGDMDGDGDLDLIAGKWILIPVIMSEEYYAVQSSLLLNNGTSNPFAGVTESIISNDSNYTYAVALGDVDSDGDLDLVAGNRPGEYRTGSETLYLNRGGNVPFANVAGTSITALALGDMESDGDLDLVGGTNLYLNNGTAASFTSVLFGAQAAEVVALGDINGDGKIDLISCWSITEDFSSVSYIKIYQNEELGMFSTGTPIDLEVSGNILEMVLGDVDGDGDLDLVTINEGYFAGARVILHLNNGRAQGFFSNPGIAINHFLDRTTAVALGDVDGDSDLDLVTGNWGHAKQLFLNNGTTAPFENTGTLIGLDIDRTYAVALGDVDGDGDLDLVAGNGDQANKLYLNNGTTDPFRYVTGTPISSDISGATSVALGDMDGDGDLDLVAGKLYLNNGTSAPFAGVAGTAIGADPGTASAIALGDMDGDGYLDVVTPNKLYLHPGPMRRLPNNPPYGVITRPDADSPGGTDNAPFFSAGRIISNTQVISLPFMLFDPEGDAADVRGEYSLDGGGRWLPASATTSMTLTNLPATPEPNDPPYIFPWDLNASGVSGQSDSVVFRLIVSPSVKPQPGSLAGPYQYASTASTTFPLRLQANIARVVSAAQPDGVSGALVYRLPKSAVRDAPPLTYHVTNAPLASNDHGYVFSRDPIQLGDRLIALLPLVITDTYTLYASSAPPGSLGQTVTRFGTQTLSVTTTNPLLLFNLTISLEWDARADPLFLARLRRDLRRASELLYTWSGGQVALGDLTIYQDKQRWDTADIQILASNRLRPNAQQGGIAGGTDPDKPAISYQRGQLRIGAVWSRYGSGESLGEDWPRTLAHELGHYLLYLDDNYLGYRDGQLVEIDSCPGAMSDPYNDDAFHPDGAAWAADCAETLSHVTTGRSDWATIQAMYAWPNLGVALKSPASYSSPALKPPVLPLEVTRISEDTGGLPPAPAYDTLLVTLTDTAGARYLPGQRAQAYLLNTAGDRLTDLGSPTLDMITVRGARAGDQVCLSDPERGGAGCAAVDPADLTLPVHAQPAGWAPDLRVTVPTSTTVGLEVRGLAPGHPLQAQIFLRDGWASAVITPSLNPAGAVYTATLSLPPGHPAFGGVVRLWEVSGSPALAHSQTNGAAEIMASFGIGGSPGPSPCGGMCKDAPVLSPDGRVLLYAPALDFDSGEFYTLQTATAEPEAPAWLTRVGPAYRLSATAGAPPLSDASINLSYFADEVAAANEGGVAVYVYDEQRGAWLRLPGNERDAGRNMAWATAAGPGLYRLMAGVDVPLAHAGWNLLAFYPGADADLPAALGSIVGRYRSVYGYAAGDWRLYAPGAPAWASDLHTLRYGAGYWIDATEATTATLRPQLQGDAGVLALPPATYYGLLRSGLSAGQVVTATIAGNDCGTARAWAQSGGVAFVVDVLSEGSRAGCGLPGRTVTLTVGERTFTLPWASGPHQVGLIYLPIMRH